MIGASDYLRHLNPINLTIKQWNQTNKQTMKQQQNIQTEILTLEDFAAIKKLIKSGIVDYDQHQQQQMLTSIQRLF